MIYGTAAVGEIVHKNTEQAATARGGRAERCSRGRASSILVLAGDRKNMEIPILHSNKTVHEYCCAAVHDRWVGMMGGCVGGHDGCWSK